MRPSDSCLALFRRLPVLAALLGPDGCFLEVSDTWVSRTGYKRESLRGVRPEDLATTDSARRIREEYRPTLRRTRQLVRVPVEFLTASGGTLELRVSTTAEFDDAGVFLHSLSVFTEFADRRDGTRPFLTETEMRHQQRTNLVAALEAAGWRIAGKGGAAELLGLRPSTLTDRMKSLQVRRPAYGQERDQGQKKGRG